MQEEIIFLVGESLEGGYEVRPLAILLLKR
jgi:hypothetical protein